MQFRLTVLLSVIVLTGCAAQATEDTAAAEPASPAQELVAANASPVVGTWRWSASGHSIGKIPLGEEDFVFRNDGTYAVISKSGDGSSDCYEGTFTWSTSGEPGRGTLLFKSARIRDTVKGFEREVYLDSDDVLHFGDGGTYKRTNVAVDTRCP